MANRFDTHEVVNQAPPLTGYDVFGADVALAEALERNGAAGAVGELHELGRRRAASSHRSSGGEPTRTRRCS